MWAQREDLIFTNPQGGKKGLRDSSLISLKTTGDLVQAFLASNIQDLCFSALLVYLTLSLNGN